jgi:hypothetical protein
VVVMIGSNDRQAITVKGQSLAARSPEWTAEYQSRVSKFMKEITDKKLSADLGWTATIPSSRHVAGYAGT